MCSIKGKNYKRFLDFQNDVAVDIEIAFKEGYRSIEHVKKIYYSQYATDQGKTSNLNGLQLVSEIENKVVPSVGHTTFRTTIYTGLNWSNRWKRGWKTF